MNETKDRIKKLEDTIAEETKSKAQLVEKTKTLEAGIDILLFYLNHIILEQIFQNKKII